MTCSPVELLALLGILLTACKGEDCDPLASVPVGTRFQVEVLTELDAPYDDCSWIALEPGTSFVVEAGNLQSYDRPDTSECTFQNIAGAPEGFPSDHPLDICTLGPGYFVECQFLAECPVKSVGNTRVRLNVPTQSGSKELELHVEGGFACQGVAELCAESYRILVTRIDE